MLRSNSHAVRNVSVRLSRSSVSSCLWNLTKPITAGAFRISFDLSSQLFTESAAPAEDPSLLAKFHKADEKASRARLSPLEIIRSIIVSAQKVGSYSLSMKSRKFPETFALFHAFNILSTNFKLEFCRLFSALALGFCQHWERCHGKVWLSFNSNRQSAQWTINQAKERLVRCLAE